MKIAHIQQATHTSEGSEISGCHFLTECRSAKCFHLDEDFPPISFARETVGFFHVGFMKLTVLMTNSPCEDLKIPVREIYLELESFCYMYSTKELRLLQGDDLLYCMLALTFIEIKINKNLAVLSSVLHCTLDPQWLHYSFISSVRVGYNFYFLQARD